MFPGVTFKPPSDPEQPPLPKRRPPRCHWGSHRKTIVLCAVISDHQWMAWSFFYRRFQFPQDPQCAPEQPAPRSGQPHLQSADHPVSLRIFCKKTIVLHRLFLTTSEWRGHFFTGVSSPARPPYVLQSSPHPDWGTQTDPPTPSVNAPSQAQDVHWNRSCH